VSNVNNENQLQILKGKFVCLFVRKKAKLPMNLYWNWSMDKSLLFVLVLIFIKLEVLIENDDES
jgi:hypothetical protein